MPSDAAKNARTCETKWRSLSLSLTSQSLWSCARSTSSAVQNDASAFLYMAQTSLCSIGKRTKRFGFSWRSGSGTCGCGGERRGRAVGATLAAPPPSAALPRFGRPRRTIRAGTASARSETPRRLASRSRSDPTATVRTAGALSGGADELWRLRGTACGARTRWAVFGDRGAARASSLLSFASAHCRRRLRGTPRQLTCSRPPMRAARS
mmetsp:Transcript_20804/g.62227  ORF Transcript_20804/g.62227 Transcript_20804/m.62227 type:complete len:209 (+) Transcript_20804:380-1006(+)